MGDSARIDLSVPSEQLHDKLLVGPSLDLPLEILRAGCHEYGTRRRDGTLVCQATGKSSKFYGSRRLPKRYDPSSNEHTSH